MNIVILAIVMAVVIAISYIKGDATESKKKRNNCDLCMLVAMVLLAGIGIIGIIITNNYEKNIAEKEDIKPIEEIRWDFLRYEKNESGYDITYTDPKRHSRSYEVKQQTYDNDMSYILKRTTRHYWKCFYIQDIEYELILSETDYGKVIDWIGKQEFENRKRHEETYCILEDPYIVSADKE